MTFDHPSGKKWSMNGCISMFSKYSYVGNHRYGNGRLNSDHGRSDRNGNLGFRPSFSGRSASLLSRSLLFKTGLLLFKWFTLVERRTVIKDSRFGLSFRFGAGSGSGSSCSSGFRSGSGGGLCEANSHSNKCDGNLLNQITKLYIASSKVIAILVICLTFIIGYSMCC